MKKTALLLLAALLLTLLPASQTAYAADNGSIYAADAENENLATPSEAGDHAFLEDRGYISLKPYNDGIGQICFNISARVGGEYEITIHYAAKSGDARRKLGLAVNDLTSIQNIDLSTAGDWDTIITYTQNVTLVTGENTVYITTPTDYDNTTVKTPNIYRLDYKLVQAEAGSSVLYTYYAPGCKSENLKDTLEYMDHVLYDDFGYIRMEAEEGTTGYVHFQIPVKLAGEKTVSLIYAMKDQGTAAKTTLLVNGEKAEELTLAVTDNTVEDPWAVLVTQTFTLNLEPGENIISVSSATDSEENPLEPMHLYALSIEISAEENEMPMPTSTPVPTTPDSGSEDVADCGMEDTSGENTQAEQTSGFVIGILPIILVVLVIAGVIIVILFKKKK